MLLPENLMNEIYDKAIELKINPTLLLAAISEIVEDNEVQDEVIIKRFRRTGLKGLKEVAESQLQHKKESMRSAAIYALQDASEEAIKQAASKDVDDIYEYVTEGKAIKNYHIAELEYVERHVSKVIKKYKKQVQSERLAVIIQKLAGELIIRCTLTSILVNHQLELQGLEAKN
jgi:hypothetical protein